VLLMVLFMFSCPHWRTGMLFSFGRDVNINWKHGVNAVAEEEFTGQGRISIVLWGKASSNVLQHTP
jgi:hypothetical protein